MSINQLLKPITTEQREHIYIGGCSLEKLAKQYGTPLYVIDEATVRGICREYKDAFKDCPNVKMLYASKALCNSAVCRILDEEGFGFDAVSGGEIFTIYKSDVDMSNVLFNGNNKTKEELELALDMKVGRISVDNFYEAELLNGAAIARNTNVDVLLRVTPGVECHTHDYIKTGQIDSKFGFDMNRTDEIVTLIKESYTRLNIKGLHAHIGSQIFELKSFYDEVDILINEVARINKKYALNLDELNIGGGLGVKYTQSDNPPDVKDLARVVKDALNKNSVNINRLYLEPGRSIISTSGVTLYTVGSSKNIKINGNNKKYVAVDGGMADNPRPSMYQSEYIAEAVNLQNLSCRHFEKVTIAGRYCESGDILIKDIELPVLMPGDIICVYNTGAYNYSMASNYNRVEKPAMVLVNNGVSEVIVKRETLDDLIRCDVIPDRLKK
jgi:diaminopimelate decarboxylase